MSDERGEVVARDSGDRDRLRDRAPEWFRELQRRRSIAEIVERETRGH